MDNNGWIKLHRKIKDWRWYGDPAVKIVFLELLITANHTSKEWEGITVERGQVVTGRKVLSQILGLSEMQVRVALTKLKTTNEITIKSTNKYSVITLNNFDKYQDSNQQDNHPVTNKQPASNQQITTTKNEKNERRTTNVVGSTPRTYGNKYVNEVIEYTKQKFNLPALSGSEDMNRRYAWNTLQKFKKPDQTVPDQSSSDAVKAIIDVGSRNQYWRTRISSMQKLYDNVMDIALEMRREVRNS